jgi:uncharacterized membrane protein YGL010W
MRTVSDWLGEYAVSHQNPTNKLLHWICVPAIVLAVMGLLWATPVPAAFAARSPRLNWAVVVAAAAIVYYLLLWQSSLVIFVVAWIGQFIGHLVEGRRPSFFKDVQFLLIGPLWLLAAAYRRLSLRY